MSWTVYRVEDCMEVLYWDLIHISSNSPTYKYTVFCVCVCVHYIILNIVVKYNIKFVE